MQEQFQRRQGKFLSVANFEAEFIRTGQVGKAWAYLTSPESNKLGRGQSGDTKAFPNLLDSGDVR